MKTPPKPNLSCSDSVLASWLGAKHLKLFWKTVGLDVLVRLLLAHCIFRPLDERDSHWSLWWWRRRKLMRAASSDVSWWFFSTMKIQFMILGFLLFFGWKFHSALGFEKWKMIFSLTSRPSEELETKLKTNSHSCFSIRVKISCSTEFFSFRVFKGRKKLFIASNHEYNWESNAGKFQLLRETVWNWRCREREKEKQTFNNNCIKKEMAQDTYRQIARRS